MNNQVKKTKGYEGLIKRKVNDNNTKITMLQKEARVYHSLSNKLLINHVILKYIYIYMQYSGQSISQESGEIRKLQQLASALRPTEPKMQNLYR